MKKTTLTIYDQVNVQFSNLDPVIRREIKQNLRYFISYAPHTPHYKLGRWDGYEYLFSIGAKTYIYLLDRILPILVENNWEIELDDKRPSHSFSFPAIDENIFSDIIWPANHKHEDEPIVLMDHQVDALNNFLNDITCIQELPTSAGKTLLTAAMSKFIEPYGKSIIIVPNKSLVRQTEDDYKNLDLDVGVYFGDRKELGHTHTICTWQILNVLDKKHKNYIAEEEQPLLELMAGVICVIVDECHGAKAKALKNLLSGPLRHVPIRWGLTGTIPKEKYDADLIRCMLGEVIFKIQPKELQDKGLMADCDIQIVQIKDDMKFSDYHSEYKYLVTDPDRLKWLAKFINTEIKDNTLILVKNIKTGKMLNELIPNSIFISGSTKVEDRKEHYENIAVSDENIIIATYGVAAVGINVPRIFNLILFEPGKSFIRVIQSIGRGLRLAKDKNHVSIWDIASKCKYSNKHLNERKKYYREKEYPFTLEKIEI